MTKTKLVLKHLAVDSTALGLYIYIYLVYTKVTNLTHYF